MTKRLEVYKCEKCGNTVLMVHGGKGEMVCCEQPMKLMAENTVEASWDKHIPVIEKVEGGILVKVGSEAHPMLEEHYIEWIELQAGAKVCLAFLKPGDKPEALFPISADSIVVRAYCNLHGLWKANS